ncbi:cationic amino acid transporter 4-like [Diadema antillarum]|uniref:cationic amino acid transporter 4-like n=1 Tax=Diadema antillarum TaxID=105358 RepID=UPI003A840E34
MALIHSCWGHLAHMTRRKTLGAAEDPCDTPLQRKLTTVHLVLMGLGIMVGNGLYVLTGVEAKETTGPATVVSYALSGIASLLSAICFAEFACRIPRTGSSYTFTYISMGEIWAFLIGWNVILEYAISAAAIAVAFIGYLDFLCGGALSNFMIISVMRSNLWTVPFFAPYPNIFSVIFLASITVAVVLGINVSAAVNGVLVGINAVVILIIIILGLQKADIRNWQDYGGFVPYGPGSVFSGAATLFFSYCGFDAIAYANEEAVNPRKSIPRAMFISILITITVYMLCSALLTLMVPYTTLDESSAFAGAFVANGVGWARWVVSIGALCSMVTSNFMCLYCLQRSFYAMAIDGLLFSCLGRVNETTRVPVFAALCSLVLVSPLAVFFSLPELVEFLSIGFLLGYIFVACAIIIMRYRHDPSPEDAAMEMQQVSDEQRDVTRLLSSVGEGRESCYNERLLANASSALPGTLKEKFREVPLLRQLARFRPGVVVNTCLGLSVVLISGVILVLKYGFQDLLGADWWAILLLVFFLVGGLVSLLVIPLHEQNQVSGDYYRVPWVPFVPWLSILCNLVMVLHLRAITWCRFLIWVVIGLAIYLFYGFRHSKEGKERQQSEPRANQSNPGQASASYGSIRGNIDTPNSGIGQN